MKTEDLIASLAAEAAPVRPLAGPAVRAARWLLISLPLVAVVVAAHGSLPGLDRLAADPRFVVETVATALTAVLAAIAAFAAVVPGTSRVWLAAPLLPLAVWLAAVGQGCVDDWNTMGASALAIRIDWDCFLPMVAVGVAPAVVLVLMLRSGAPVRPRLALALGGLAVGAVANLGLQSFHIADISLMVLIWHLGAVGVLALVSAWAGPVVLPWQSTRRAV